MICKSCHNRVPDKDHYCVNCGRVLRPGWVNWLALALIVGALFSCAPAAFSLATVTGSVSDRLDDETTLTMNGAQWLALASVQAVAAVYLLVQRHRLLRNVALAAIFAGGFIALSLFLSVFLSGPVIILAVVLFILFRRR